MNGIELKPEHRMAGYGALIGFILSLLLGFIVRNPAHVVIIRALVSAIIFGGIAFGGLYVLGRYIPELIGVDTEEDSGGTAEETAGIAALAAAADGDPSKSIFDSIAERAEGEGGQPADLFGSGAGAGKEENQAPPADGSRGTGADAAAGAGAAAGAKGSLPSFDTLFAQEREGALPDDLEREVYDEAPSNATGGVIEVGNAKIPYEPEQLAKAIQKVMRQDEY